MQDPTKELLRMIYVDAKSGCEAITGILPKITDERLRRETAVQLEAYAGYAKQAEILMAEKKIDGICFPLMNRLTVRGGVIMETAGAPAQSDLALLLQSGTKDGADRMRRAAAELAGRGCAGDVVALAQNMVRFADGEAERLGTIAAQ